MTFEEEYKLAKSIISGNSLGSISAADQHSLIFSIKKHIAGSASKTIFEKPDIINPYYLRDDYFKSVVSTYNFKIFQKLNSAYLKIDKNTPIIRNQNNMTDLYGVFSTINMNLVVPFLFRYTNKSFGHLNGCLLVATYNFQDQVFDRFEIVKNFSDFLKDLYV